jgi:hypothetical protein
MYLVSIALEMPVNVVLCRTCQSFLCGLVPCGVLCCALDSPGLGRPNTQPFTPNQAETFRDKALVLAQVRQG